MAEHVRGPLLQDATEGLERLQGAALARHACVPTLRILLIDDDEDCAVITRRLLSLTGGSYALEWVSDDKAGIQALLEERPDACLLDYRLGAHDGLELLREAVASGCRVPIIMLTGQGDQEIDLQAMEAGAADFLDKDSLDSSRLERSLRYAVERQRLLDRLHQANEILEMRVQERTAALAAANQSLTAEIGERRHAEAALRESEAELRIVLSNREIALKEKELLLRELHHRVKNNLQIISSLLSLEGSRIQDRASQELFKECQNRVRTIALVHEKLHRRPNLVSFDLASYLRELVDNLLCCYRVHSGAIAPRITVEKGVALSIDHLIPCALIVNELVCNALKHAFPEGRSGEIRVEVARKNGQFVLLVADDGAGCPSPGASRGRDCGGGMGRQIVQALVEQLSGTLEWSNESKSSATITFPEELHVS